jgi:hypothetical protein
MAGIGTGRPLSANGEGRQSPQRVEGADGACSAESRPGKRQILAEDNSAASLDSADLAAGDRDNQLCCDPNCCQSSRDGGVEHAL